MTFELIYEPRHWNQNCACMIPEAWTALIYDGDESSKWPCGRTREEALANVRREFPSATEFVEQ